jgi:DNA-directed RNA polymerase alpha subunit
MPHEAKISGPIEELRLPPRAWKVLQREHITNIDQLIAAAYRIDQFSGIGTKTAHVIREELVRVVSLKEQLPKHPS